jgi:predicted HicB family RNase H-like nuclease
MKRIPAVKEGGVKVAATVIIHDAKNMTKKGREQVAEWLANQATSLFEYGNAYSKQFRARYYYRPKKG